MVWTCAEEAKGLSDKKSDGLRRPGLFELEYHARNETMVDSSSLPRYALKTRRLSSGQSCTILMILHLKATPTVMGVSEKEVDFPRGGAPSVRTPNATKSAISKSFKIVNDENQLFGVPKKRKSKSKGPSTSETPSKKKKSEEKTAVWSKPVTLELLTDGVMGLGVVIEIHEDYVLLEAADSCRVKLPATQISKKFTELLKLEKTSLESAFVVGQMVAFRVTERSLQTSAKKGKVITKKKKSSLPVVTCDPSKMYSHFSPARLVPGLVLQGIVESVEEKGAVLDIGMQSLQAFLPTQKQIRTVGVGQPVMVRIELVKSTRVIAVTAYVEQDNLCLEACQSLQLNHLTPGTIIDCEPDAEPSITAGIYVTLGNEKMYPIGSEHTCRVMSFRYADRCIVVSTRKDMLSQKFVSYKDAVPGQVVEAQVTDIHPRGVQVALNDFVKGFIPVEHAADKKVALEKAFVVGKSVKCRVWFVNETNKQVWLTARPSLVNYK
ncbi:hypothetical protein TELCIR_12364, partial [Teladorsagia circumcincta]